MLYYQIMEHQTSTEWVVFIHGAGGSSRVWFKQVREYKKHFNLLFIDLRGHGKSNKKGKQKKAKYTFSVISQDIIEVLNHLRLRQCHFVGISLGTIVIREIAGIEPDFVKSMVMAGAVIKFDVRSKLLLFSANMAKRIIPFEWLYKLYAYILMPKKKHKGSRKVFINEAMKLARTEFLNWMSLSSQLNKILSSFWETELPIPTIYIMGEYDYIFLAQVSIMLRSHTNYSKLEIISGAGHVCNVDESEKFNEISIQFIQQVIDNQNKSFEC